MDDLDYRIAAVRAALSGVEEEARCIAAEHLRRLDGLRDEVANWKGILLQRDAALVEMTRKWMNEAERANDYFACVTRDVEFAQENRRSSSTLDMMQDAIAKHDREWMEAFTAKVNAKRAAKESTDP